MKKTTEPNKHLLKCAEIIVAEMVSPVNLVEFLLEAMAWSHNQLQLKKPGYNGFDGHYHYKMLIEEVGIPWFQSIKENKRPSTQIANGLASAFDYINHEEYQGYFIAGLHEGFAVEFVDSILNEAPIRKAMRGMNMFMKLNKFLDPYFEERDEEKRRHFSELEKENA